jgi:hypothetical protein
MAGQERIFGMTATPKQAAPQTEGIHFVTINVLALLVGDIFQAKVPVNGSGNNQRQGMVCCMKAWPYYVNPFQFLEVGLALHKMIVSIPQDVSR